MPNFPPTAADKLRILADVDRTASAGRIGAVRRRKALYFSTLSDWHRLRGTGAFGALTPAEIYATLPVAAGNFRGEPANGERGVCERSRAGLQ